MPEQSGILGETIRINKSGWLHGKFGVVIGIYATKSTPTYRIRVKNFVSETTDIFTMKESDFVVAPPTQLSNIDANVLLRITNHCVSVIGYADSRANSIQVVGDKIIVDWEKGKMVFDKNGDLIEEVER